MKLLFKKYMRKSIVALLIILAFAAGKGVSSLNEGSNNPMIDVQINIILH